MAQIVESSRNVVSTLGRGSVQTDTYGGSTSETTKGEQIVTKAEERPEIITTKAAPVHVGVAFEFTLSWQGRGNKA